MTKKTPKNNPAIIPAKEPAVIDVVLSERTKMYRRIFIIVLAVALIGTLVVSGYIYTSYQSAKEDVDLVLTSDELSVKSKRIIKDLGDILLITDTVEPTIARIDDVDQLTNTNRDFYENAENGDYLIVYPTRAIVYRTSNKQIINIAPIVKTADQGN
jgi:hypothetical protein